ncbi:serine O-acetyltransferase [Methyloterricola oryzae]|uniref:serine O-acetyltransferase n=1 Tax=Methyloterricola oryzae TaxID=1495050 RepID=UPI0005EB5FD1|nr:serine O-acetyltransferase [Methyloterricola oryzae]
MLKRLKDEFGSIFERDPAAQSYFEILTTYPGVHAVLMHRLNHRLWRFGLRWPARLLSYLVRWLTGIEIHPGATIGRRLFIDHGMGVVIGETAVIGDDCTLYHSVTLGGTTWKKGKRHPTLGKGVVIGAGAKVLGPIEVGDGARIGSNSVVLKNVPAGATVVGIPGHLVNPDREALQAQRQAIASKVGFDAYGMTSDMPDPVAHAINHMLDHIQKLDEQVEAMKAALLAHGVELQDAPLPELEHCQLAQCKDDTSD